jgi:hypothetical protein
VKTAVGLDVDAIDVDDPDHLDVRRQQVARDANSVRIARACSRSSTRTSICRFSRTASLQASSTRCLKSADTSDRSKSIRAMSGSMFPPVIGAPSDGRGGHQEEARVAAAAGPRVSQSGPHVVAGREQCSRAPDAADWD